MSSNNHQLQPKLDEITVGEIIPTKFGLELMAESIAEQVANGEHDPLNVAIKMNAMEQLVKLVRERISDSVMTELQKYPKQKAEILGASVSVMESIKYDFSHLPGWSELDAQIAELKEKQKAIEDHEKTYFKGNLPVKSATTTFKISLSK
jgi:hypothetical protein